VIVSKWQFYFILVLIFLEKRREWNEKKMRKIHYLNILILNAPSHYILDPRLSKGVAISHGYDNWLRIIPRVRSPSGQIFDPWIGP